MAAFPNIVCKLSGVATEADHRSWTEAQLLRYVEAAVDAFGFERLMFGGDWPVTIQAIDYTRWVDLLDRFLTGLDAATLDAFWRGNARRVYRI